MVSSISGSTPYSLLTPSSSTNLLTPAPTPTPAPAPAAASTGVTGGSSSTVSLSSLVLSLLQNANTSDDSGLLGSSSTYSNDDSILNVLKANSLSNLVKAAYSSASQKALDVAASPPVSVSPAVPSS